MENRRRMSDNRSHKKKNRKLFFTSYLGGFQNFFRLVFRKHDDRRMHFEWRGDTLFKFQGANSLLPAAEEIKMEEKVTSGWLRCFFVGFKGFRNHLKTYSCGLQ